MLISMVDGHEGEHQNDGQLQLGEFLKLYALSRDDVGKTKKEDVLNVLNAIRPPEDHEDGDGEVGAGAPVLPVDALLAHLFEEHGLELDDETRRDFFGGGSEITLEELAAFLNISIT